jgi:hypothetical protein
MHGMRDGAVWKKLALALGDGLAFGVGVNLSNNAASRITPPPPPEMGSLADRLTGIEQRMEKARHNNALPGVFQQKMVEAVVSVVDARLREQSAQLEKRVTDEIAALRGEVGQQLAANRKTAAEENDLLRGQMMDLHRQFAESVARLVDEQIAATVELRVAPLASAVEANVNDRVQPMQSEVADLQRRVGENDRDTLELVLAIGRLCLETAERLTAVVPQQSPVGSPLRVAETAPADPASVWAEVPQANLPKAPWRIPLVSSFFFVSGGLLLLHYL